MNEYEKFYGTTIRMGDVIRVTIPMKLCKFMGIKEMDDVVVMIKKIEKEE